VAVFLGAEAEAVKRRGMIPAETLEEAALRAVALSKGSAPRCLAAPKSSPKALPRAAKGQRFVRGLFSGGTFCTEAQLVFQNRKIKDVHSNVPLPPTAALADVWKSAGHTLIDLGDDAFTVGRPHPMIDFSLRNRRILDEAKDPGTAVILLDVVIGYGANMDPVGELAPVIRDSLGLARKAKRELSFVCSVTGTPQDPQDRDKVAAGLKAAGALVFESNAAACRFAADAVQGLGKN